MHMPQIVFGNCSKRPPQATPLFCGMLTSLISFVVGVCVKLPKPCSVSVSPAKLPEEAAKVDWLQRLVNSEG